MATTHQNQPGWLSVNDCSVSELDLVVQQRADIADYPYATSIEREIVVYDAGELRRALAAGQRRAVLAELAQALSVGPGIVAFTGAIASGIVTPATAVFEELIAEQHRTGTARGDHFAKPGANDRVWNALEKLAVQAPDVFVDYYASDMLALVSQAWLGPGYQMTSQINIVNPGGQAQSPHRDYHLGFLSDAVAEGYPTHVHMVSPMLTLQGAVAHCDMPEATGPTLYLPHSHKYPSGYLAWRRPDVIDYFNQHYAQLPLAKGDAVFFNPAVLHAAGTNVTSDIKRMANLLQVSSAFGRAMETIDRTRMIEAVYPSLMARRAAGLSNQAVSNAVAAMAEGYAFPTNLDRDPPLNGLAPASQADVVHRALAQNWTTGQLQNELAQYSTRRRSHS